MFDNEPVLGKLLLWEPNILWGYDGGELLLPAVSGLHGKEYVSFTWCQNGVELCSGPEYMCLAVHGEGIYQCMVLKGEEAAVSKPVHVRMEQTNTDENQTLSVPLIDQSDLKFGRNEDDIIGEGGFGKVYRGSWEGTEVAIKEIKTNVRGRSQQEVFMRKEIQIHSRIRHPNIVQIMAVANTNQSVLIISEYIQGPNLEEVIFGENKHILDGNKKNFAVQICRAVAYLHARNPQIIHQDIKPANILINLQGKIIKLCDLGISKMKILGSSTSTCATTMPGTIMYMAPESIMHRKSFAASDVWSLGCTLLEMFTESDTWDILTG